MKTITKILITFLASFLAIGCSSSGDVPKEEKIQYQYTKDEQYERIWETKIVHNETVVLKENDDGSISGKLLYAPKSIICVRNFGLNLVYSYANDYYVRGKTIYRKPDSIMPYLTKDNISCKNIPSSFTGGGASGTFPGKGNTKILFTETPAIVSYCICVSYTHNESFKGTTPTSKGNKLTTLRNKLETNQNVNLVTLGDSICVGGSSSAFLKVDPEQDTLIDGFAHEIERKYKNKVTSTNLAVGATVSSNGISLSQNLAQYNPDVVVVGYGMNDASTDTATMYYIQNIRLIIDNIRTNNKNASIVLIGSVLASYSAIIEKYNDLLFNYVEKLLHLENEYDNLAVFDMTNFSKEIADNKNSLDLYANNVNHPNDWMVRNYIAGLSTTISY